MAGSVNKVILIGRVGADPDIKSTQSGNTIANLRIATSETWKDKNSGERKEKTEWTTVVIFNEGIAKVVENYVRKGTQIYVEGQLQTRKWQDKDGADRYSTEVVLSAYSGSLTLLGGKPEGDAGERSESRRQAAGKAPAQRSFSAELDDEIPFD